MRDVLFYSLAIVMIKAKRPDIIIIIISLSQYFQYLTIKIFFLEHPQNRMGSEHFIVKNVLLLNKLKNLFLRAWSYHIVKTLEFINCLSAFYCDILKFFGLWNYDIISTCIGRVHFELSLIWEIKISLEGKCWIGIQACVHYLSVLMAH